MLQNLICLEFQKKELKTTNLSQKTIYIKDN